MKVIFLHVQVEMELAKFKIKQPQAKMKIHADCFIIVLEHRNSIKIIFCFFCDNSA